MEAVNVCVGTAPCLEARRVRAAGYKGGKVWYCKQWFLPWDGEKNDHKCIQIFPQGGVDRSFFFNQFAIYLGSFIVPLCLYIKKNNLNLFVELLAKWQNN